MTSCTMVGVSGLCHDQLILGAVEHLAVGLDKGVNLVLVQVNQSAHLGPDIVNKEAVIGSQDVPLIALIVLVLAH